MTPDEPSMHREVGPGAACHQASSLAASRRAARSSVPLLIYLSAFTIALIIVCRVYLIPAMKLASTATASQRRVLAADAQLLLTLLLIGLLGLLVIALRSSKYTRRGLSGSRKPTIYPDAWSESARRLKTPPEE